MSLNEVAYSTTAAWSGVPRTLVGRTIAKRYRIEAHVGGGAMGDVYRARHVQLGFDVALKIMCPSLAREAREAGFEERFYREARAASSLEHRNSVRVIDYGQEDDGLVYLAMEFLRGRDLHSVLRTEGPLSDHRIADILVQTLAAVSVAHANGIVHRDLKPQNIMVVADDDDVSRDCVKVCDFGIAKLNDPRLFKWRPDARTDLTGGGLIGTPGFMSPEQARGGAVDARSDLYSVGVILYQMLAGRLPFDADNALVLALKHLTDEPVPPSRLRPQVNPRLEAICLRAMRKDPAERYASAMEMRAELRAAIGAPSSLPDLGEIERTRPMIDSQAPCVTDLGDPDAEDAADAEPGSLDVDVRGVRAGVPLLSRWRPIGLAVAALLVASLSAWGIASKRRREPPPTVGASDSRAEVAVPPSPPALPAPPLSTSPASSSPDASPSAPIPSPATRRGTARNTMAVTVTHSSRASTPAPRPAPAAAYNPNHALVSLGRLTTERVQRDVVQRKLAELVPRLNDCYRDALFVAAAPIRGTASIHLSIDSGGRVVTIVSTAELPPFARCADRVLMPLSLPAFAVESGGGVAEQTVTLTP